MRFPDQVIVGDGTTLYEVPAGYNAVLNVTQSDQGVQINGQTIIADSRQEFDTSGGATISGNGNYIHYTNNTGYDLETTGTWTVPTSISNGPTWAHQVYVGTNLVVNEIQAFRPSTIVRNWSNETLLDGETIRVVIHSYVPAGGGPWSSTIDATGLGSIESKMSMKIKLLEGDQVIGGRYVIELYEIL
jgi:hypothetical protein